jgi:hypothetical protein
MRTSTHMSDDEEAPIAEGRASPPPVARVPPPRDESRGGVGAGIGLGIALIVVQLFCSSLASSHFPRNTQVEFGTPIDPTGSLVFFFVQAAFLAAAVGMVAAGVVLAKRRPAVAAMLVAAAVTLAVVATPCTLSAWTIASAARTP